MQLLTTKNFHGIKLACYKDESNPGDFWATREQIGRLLGYETPGDSIKKIHKRNRERLDRFSSGVKLSLQSANGVIEQRYAVIYNFKGLLEICRFSNQPKANEVMDFLWEIADEIRTKGYYTTPAIKQQLKSLQAMNEALIAENTKLREKIERELPCTTVGKIVLSSARGYTVQLAAQVLAQHGLPIGQNRLFKKFRDEKLLCSRKGKQWNKPTQRAIEQGLLGLQESGHGLTVIVMPQFLAKIADTMTAQNLPIVYLFDREDNSPAVVGDSHE